MKYLGRIRDVAATVGERHVDDKESLLRLMLEPATVSTRKVKVLGVLLGKLPKAVGFMILCVGVVLMADLASHYMDTSALDRSVQYHSKPLAIPSKPSIGGTTKHDMAASKPWMVLP